MFSTSKPKRLVILSGLIYIIILLLLNYIYIIPLIMNYFLAEYVSSISTKKIDGLSGDVYGAIIELGETISLLSFWFLTL